MTVKQEIAMLNRQAEIIKTMREEMEAELAALEQEFSGKGAHMCEHPECCEDAYACSCDGCDAHFCEEHGYRGGDQLVGDCLTAVPATCWRCQDAGIA